MFRSLIMSVASVALVASVAMAQSGTIVSIDAEQKLIVLKVEETEYKVDATAVKLLDGDGNEAKLADFAKKESVDVTVTDGAVTHIQKVKKLLDSVAQDPADGKVVKVEADTDLIVVKVGDAEYTAHGKDISLLNAKGDAATLTDFAAGGSVKVTLKDGAVTTIQIASKKK